MFPCHAIQYAPLTHWGRVTHICVGKLTIIGSDNGLSPDRRQAIILTNAGILIIGPLGTNFSEILIEIQTFSLKKIRFKMSSAKCCSFRLGLNVSTELVRRMARRMRKLLESFDFCVTRVLMQWANSSKTHPQLKFCEKSFTYNILFTCLLTRNVHGESSGSITFALCTKFQTPGQLMNHINETSWHLRVWWVSGLGVGGVSFSAVTHDGVIKWKHLPPYWCSLWGKLIGQRWISLKKNSNAVLDAFVMSPQPHWYSNLDW